MYGQGIQRKDERLHGQGIKLKYKERRRMRDCMDRVYNGRIKNGEEKLKILEFAGKAAREGNPLEN